MIGQRCIAVFSLVALGIFGVTNNQKAIAQPALCRTAFAFDSNYFGDCSPSTSLLIGENQPSKLLMLAFENRTTTRVAFVIAQYQNDLAANYAQMERRRGLFRVQDRQSGEQVASSLMNIHCLTNVGPASYLCYPNDNKLIGAIGYLAVNSEP